MNMFLRIITFQVSCGFCASQASVNDGNSSFCPGGPLAMAQYDHSEIILKSIDTTSKMFAAMKVHATETSRNLIKIVVDDNLNRVRDYQSSWKDNLKFIMHMSQFINVNHSIPYCGDIIEVAKEWHRQNLVVETILGWASHAYNRIYHCDIQYDSSKCVDADEMKHVLDDTETSEHADDMTNFHKTYQQLLTRYDETGDQFSLFYCMILWFRTLKLSNINFDDDTSRWLSDGFDLIDNAMLKMEYGIKDVHEDIQAIGSLLKSVFRKQKEISDLLEYFPTIKSRLPQMDQIFVFLFTSIRTMKTYSAPLWDQQFREFSISFDEQYPDEQEVKKMKTHSASPWTKQLSVMNYRFEQYNDAPEPDAQEPDEQNQAGHVISSVFNLRENIESSLSTTRTPTASAAIMSLLNINTENDNVDKPIVRSFKAMVHTFSVDQASSLQCHKEALYNMRYLAVLKIEGHRVGMGLSYEAIGAIFDVVKTYTDDFLTLTGQYFIKLRKHLDAFKENLVSPSNTFFTGASPSDDDIATHSNFLNLLSPVLKQFLDIECKTFKSVFYSEVELMYNAESSNPYMDVGSVSTNDLITWINEQFTSTKIGLFYQRFDELISLYDEAYKVFHEYDHKISRATKMSGIVERLNREKTALSDMATNGNRFYEARTYTGLEVMSGYPISPDLVEAEYGDFYSQILFPFFTTSTNPGPGDQLNGGIFDDSHTFPRGLALANHSDAVNKYHSQHDKLKIVSLDHLGLLFVTEECQKHCNYVVKFNDLRDARVAAGCYYNRHGSFYRMGDPVTADKVSVLIIQGGDSMSADVVFLDQYNKLYEETMSIIMPCRVHFAIQGQPSFTFEKLTAAIVDIPTDVPEPARYNVYSGRTDSGFKKMFYVAKGCYLPKENPPWSSITQTIRFLRTGGCHAIGVVRETVNEFGKIELTGLMYDGKDVVFHLDSACEKKAPEKSISDDDYEDEVLYMFYRATPVEEKKKFTVMFFSNKTTKGFIHNGTADSSYVLGYVNRHPDTQQDIVELTHLAEAPQNVPSDYEVLCFEETDPCSCEQYCDNGDSCIDGPCESERGYKFGVCKDNQKQLATKSGYRVKIVPYWDDEFN